MSVMTDIQIIREVAIPCLSIHPEWKWPIFIDADMLIEHVGEDIDLMIDVAIILNIDFLVDGSLIISIAEAMNSVVSSKARNSATKLAAAIVLRLIDYI